MQERTQFVIQILNICIRILTIAQNKCGSFYMKRATLCMCKCQSATYSTYKSITTKSSYLNCCFSILWILARALSLSLFLSISISLSPSLPPSPLSLSHSVKRKVYCHIQTSFDSKDIGLWHFIGYVLTTGLRRTS